MVKANETYSDLLSKAGIVDLSADMAERYGFSPDVFRKPYKVEDNLRDCL